MEYITVTSQSSKNNPSIYININFIGHIYTTLVDCYEREKKLVTIIGVSTHNNGGFRVIETPEQIIKLIEKAKKSK
jgi:hypothetical protein